ncbi:MAG: signal peptidase I [Clostridia bacterium]|nr:signal peptidase I [Clostridia bacterium]
MENKIPNSNGNDVLTPKEIEHRTRVEMIQQEQPLYDDVEIAHNPNTPQSALNPDIMEQYDQAREPSDELRKMRDYKQRQMEEFTNNYSISQVIPSGWTTFFNVMNTIFLTLALIIAFFVAFGLIFGLRIGIVPTSSMEPTISTWSLIIVRPAQSMDEIQVGDIISYQKGNQSYVHRVQSITPATDTSEALIVAVGDNPNTAGAYDLVPFRMVEGEMVVAVPGLGSVIWFVKNNIILTITAALVLILTVLLLRSIVERRHAKAEIDIFLTKKAEFEREAERKYLEMKKKEEHKEFERIMRTSYGDGDVDMQNAQNVPQNPQPQRRSDVVNDQDPIQ